MRKTSPQPTQLAELVEQFADFVTDCSEGFFYILAKFFDLRVILSVAVSIVESISYLFEP